jgi:ABC-type multidrug transport system ATPase subunit
MQILLQNASKRFNRETIFKKLDYRFLDHGQYAITGPNGSGKSTLLQVLSGNMQLSEGKCTWILEDKPIDADTVYKHIAVGAPYLELVEEMTAAEFFQFHFKFKPMLGHVTIEDIPEIIGLKDAAQKQVRLFSSGMKQRLKLAQAIFADVPVLLLDEPCTNLDDKGFELYHHLIKTYCANRLVIISSNDTNEYDLYTERINIADYK